LGYSNFILNFRRPRRREDSGKKDNELPDNISLRPHSGNFAGGCAPSMPSNIPVNNYATRFQHFHDGGESKNAAHER